MAYSFARISATLGMKVEDYYIEGRKAWFRLHEKGAKQPEVHAQPNAAHSTYAYLEAAGISAEGKTPLSRTIAGKTGQLTDLPLHRSNAIRMIKRRARAAGLLERIGCHTFRATGITD